MRFSPYRGRSREGEREEGEGRKEREEERERGHRKGGGDGRGETQKGRLSSSRKAPPPFRTLSEPPSRRDSIH